VTLWTQWLARRRKARADWEFRLGYLAAVHDRLFPDAAPMVAERDRPQTEAFHAGMVTGQRLETGLPHTHERERRFYADLAA